MRSRPTEPNPGSPVSHLVRTSLQVQGHPPLPGSDSRDECTQDGARIPKPTRQRGGARCASTGCTAFGLALLTVVEHRPFLQRPSGATNAAAPTHATGRWSPTAPRDPPIPKLARRRRCGIEFAGMEPDHPRRPKRCLIGGRGGTGRRRPHDSPADRTRLTGPVQKLRALIATFRAEQFQRLGGHLQPPAVRGVDRCWAGGHGGRSTGDTGRPSRAASSGRPDDADYHARNRDAARRRVGGSPPMRVGDNYADDTGNGY